VYGVCGRFLDWGNMATSPSPPAPLRLLIVDDHKDSARALSRLLRHEGHTVITAHTVAGALALVVGQLPVDVLISDIGLPDGDGCDLLRRLMQFYGGRDITAVALSGIDDEEYIERCREAGYHKFLVKPVSFEMVVDALKECRPAAVLPAAAVPAVPAVITTP
jgi:CheY-like chemotaxis protein